MSRVDWLIYWLFYGLSTLDGLFKAETYFWLVRVIILFCINNFGGQWIFSNDINVYLVLLGYGSSNFHWVEVCSTWSRDWTRKYNKAKKSRFEKKERSELEERNEANHIYDRKKANNRSGCIRPEDGSVFPEPHDICRRWELYIKELFGDTGGNPLPRYQIWQWNSGYSLKTWFGM